MQDVRNNNVQGSVAAISSSSGTPSRIVRIAAAWFLLLTTCAVVFARSWPLAHDAPLMHYVVFLMDHGMAPYRQIVDMNLPGSYLMDWLVMHTFGGGHVAWYCWDFVAGIGAIAASGWIAGSGKWPVGLAAGALAYLVHLRDGPENLGQRDWVVAVLLLLAVGCILASVRNNQAKWMAGFGFFCCAAAVIKPPVFLILGAFVLAVCWRQKRAGHRIPPTLLWSAAGSAVPVLAVAAFLWRWNAWQAFFSTMRGLDVWYAGLDAQGYGYMLTHLLPMSLWPLFLVALLLCWQNGSWRHWEVRFVIGGIAAGAMLFFVQRKGWPYHRYTGIAFLLLWFMIEVDFSLRGRRLQRILATAALAFAGLFVAPFLLRAEKQRSYSMDAVYRLEADLQQLGGPRISGSVQCLDMTIGGCINALYRMRLVQATGDIYDFYLFPQTGNAVTKQIQARFLENVRSDPPRVIVLSSHIWPGDTFGYSQLERWPEFQKFLAIRYRMDKEQPMGPHTLGSYRIYVLQERGDLRP